MRSVASNSKIDSRADSGSRRMREPVTMISSSICGCSLAGAGAGAGVAGKLAMADATTAMARLAIGCRSIVARVVGAADEVERT